MARTLTPLQERVLAVLLRHRIASEQSYCFSGASALSEFDLGHRLSDDLDFFSRTRSEVDVGPDAELASAALGQEGLIVDSVKVLPPAHARIWVRDFETGEALKVDFGLDHHPLDPPRLVGNVPVDSHRDMAARKLVAFFDRGEEEAKDAVDLYYLLSQAGWTLERLIAEATHKTADLDTADGLLELGRLLVGCAEPAYLDRMTRLRFPGTPPDFMTVGQRLREEGERLIQSLRPQG